MVSGMKVNGLKESDRVEEFRSGLTALYMRVAGKMIRFMD
jgi:hypothetical protein